MFPTPEQMARRGIDSQDGPLDGANNYMLNFAKGQQPPVSVLWNLAMYGADRLFVDDDFGRVSIGSTTPFNLAMRFYGPCPSVLDGS